jgi:hypothetical protein
MNEVKKAPVKYTFSGHESFQCRHLWLKKGYDYVKAGKSFNAEDAVVELGVGKNMVASIRFWMKAFDLLTPDDKLTEFAHKLLADDGWDPYLEDEASLWLLHYHLVKRGFSTTYSLVFNELRKEKIEFTKENFVAFIKRKAEGNNSQFNDNTVNDDFSVLVKMYVRAEEQSKDKEDIFSGIFTELDIIKGFSRRRDNDGKKEEYYVIENTDKFEIPDEVILYGILDNNFDLSINLSSIEQEPNNVGSVFAISRTGLLNKIESLKSKYSYLIFNDHAGIKELQFKKKPSPIEVLNKYYDAN